MEVNRLLVVAGSGAYPRLVVAGARRAGVGTVDVLALKGSTARSTCREADGVAWFGVGEVMNTIRHAAEGGYDGMIFAGQVNPLSLFRTRFDEQARAWLAAMPVKCAHTIFSKLLSEYEKAGVRVLPASLYMDDSLPGAGPLTRRGVTESEMSDIRRGVQVASDMGRHDVGQTVVVKSGMCLAVEAFEGTDAAIRRAGKLGRGSVVFKAAREGHDMRFDIPVAGLKTLKAMRKSGVTAFAFQAGRLILLDRERVVGYADRHGIAILGIDSGLPPAPTRP